MRNRLAVGIALIMLAGNGPAIAQQVFERESRIVGPKGNVIERSVRSERTPAGVRRELDIRRPDGQVHRSAMIPNGRGPTPGPGPGPYRGGPGPRGPIVIERDGGDGWVAPVAGIAGLAAGAWLGSTFSRPAPPPPPPMMVVTTPVAPIYTPTPVIMTPTPVVVAEPQPVVVQPTRPAYSPIDNVAAEIERLNSWSGNTRLDAVKLLGRLNDPRAVPYLIHALRNDSKDEVREHAAWSLGNLGDPSARPYLEVASLDDTKGKVREAAIRALQRLDAAMATETPSAIVNAPATTEPRPPSPVYSPRKKEFQVTAGPSDPENRPR